MVNIINARFSDLQKILELQKLAYQSEAELYNDYSIPPLLQTIGELEKEFENQCILKAETENSIIGSVRAYSNSHSCIIGRLIVDPKWQRKSIGTKLMNSIEARFTDVQRYEIFTGSLSAGNISLYRRLGYYQYKEQVLSEFVTLTYMQKRNPLV